MFNSYSLTMLIVIFTLAATAVWIAGIYLSKATDIIDIRFNLGEALGGLIFLAFATNLPEIAIVMSASWNHEIGIAIGNILGGIAIQTVVLAILDGIGLRSKGALSFEAASLQLVLEGALVIIILMIVIMSAELPDSFIYWRIVPGDILIVATWLTGLWLIYKARNHLPWHQNGKATNTHATKISQKLLKNHSLTTSISIFAIASIVTLLAGIVLEMTSNAIATKIGWSGILFGSTILAAITCLPEISTGLVEIKMKNYTLAISDIFGGNAFLPTLFLMATLISGQSTIPKAHQTDIYLAALGALLTAIYIYGLIFRPKKQICWLGIDSIVVIILYCLGIYGLFIIAKN